MTHPIPGTIYVEGREFFYIETSDGEDFRQLSAEAIASYPDIPLPQSGGVIEEKAYIGLEGGSSLLAISYKGDLAGWRRKWTAFCESTGRKWGIAAKQKVILSDGTEIDLSNCEVTFEE